MFRFYKVGVWGWWLGVGGCGAGIGGLKFGVNGMQIEGQCSGFVRGNARV